MTDTTGPSNPLDAFNKTMQESNKQSERIGDALSGDTEFSKDLKSNFDGIKGVFNGIQNSIKDIKISDHLKGIGKTFDELKGKIGNPVKDIKISDYLKGIGKTFDELKGKIGNSELVNTFSSAFSQEISILKEIFGILGTVGLVFKRVIIAPLVGVFAKFFGPIRKLYDYFFNSDDLAIEEAEKTNAKLDEQKEKDLENTNNLLSALDSIHETIKLLIPKKSLITSSDVSNDTVDFMDFSQLMPEPKDVEVEEESFFDKMKGYLRVISGVFASILGPIMKVVKPLFTFKTGIFKILGKVFAIFTLLKAAFDGITEGLKVYEDTGSISEAIFAGLDKFFNSVAETVMETFNMLVRGLGVILEKVGEFTGFDTSKISDILKKFDMKTILYDMFSAIFDGIGMVGDSISAIFDSISDFFTWDNIKAILMGGKDAFMDAVQFKETEETQINPKSKEDINKMNKAEALENKKIQNKVAASKGSSSAGQVAIQQTSQSHETNINHQAAPVPEVPADTATS